jgi:hypothetical protein
MAVTLETFGLDDALVKLLGPVQAYVALTPLGSDGLNVRDRLATEFKLTHRGLLIVGGLMLVIAMLFELHV